LAGSSCRRLCSTGGMPDRSSKEKKRRPADPNLLARTIVDEATEEPSEKNLAALALGRLGGPKGGKTRAKKLSKKRRVEIAKKAARSRWNRD